MGVNDYDQFQDVIENSHGIYEESAGLRDHDSVKAFVKPEGVALQFQCQGCGKPSQLLAEYPEVIALKYSVNPEIAYRGVSGVLAQPTRWEFLPQEQAWRPHMKCQQCGFWFPIRIEPHEPERFLAAARRRGFIRQPIEQQLSFIADKAAQAGMAVRR